MAALKNPDTITFTTQSMNNPPYQKPCVLYIIILNNHVFACKAHTRSHAIDIAKDSREFGTLIENEMFKDGRPVNPYTLQNMQVIRIKPWHRIGWAVSQPTPQTHIYVCLPYGGGKPLVYDGNSTILDFVSEKGLIQKVRIYNDVVNTDFIV